MLHKVLHQHHSMASGPENTSRTPHRSRQDRVIRFGTKIVGVFALVVSVPQASVAQASAERVVVSVVEELFGWVAADEDYSLVPDYGQWGVVVGWFSEGEEKEIRFEVTAGESYKIAGQGDQNVEDLDICVYDSSGREVGCDELVDAIPLVTFTALRNGTYRAALTAYSLESLTAYAGMILLRRIAPLRNSSGGAGIR